MAPVGNEIFMAIKIYVHLVCSQNYVLVRFNFPPATAMGGNAYMQYMIFLKKKQKKCPRASVAHS
jgi:hypothetical protein